MCNNFRHIISPLRAGFFLTKFFLKITIITIMRVRALRVRVACPCVVIYDASLLVVFYHLTLSQGCETICVWREFRLVKINVSEFMTHRSDK